MSYSTLSKPRTKRSLDENALVNRFREVIKKLSKDKELVLDLSSYKINTPNNPPVTIKTTNYDKFLPLSSDNFEKLKNAYIKRWNEGFPTRLGGALLWWPYDVAMACRGLAARIEEEGMSINCARYSCWDTLSTSSCMIWSLLNGESLHSACGVRWHVYAILISPPSVDYGAILTTKNEDPGLQPRQILRSELLTLLGLLKVACKRAVEDGGSSMSPTVFVLSFTFNMIRIVQARLTNDNEISVFIRERFNTDISTEEKRQKLLKDLVCSAMFVNRDDIRDRGFSRSSVRSDSSDS